MTLPSVTKIVLAGTVLLALAFLFTHRHTHSRPAKKSQPEVPVVMSQAYEAPTITGKLKSPEVDESSGLVAAQTAGFYWTHNDSGDGPYIYAITEAGASGGVWKVAGASARDWEDMAAGPGPQPNKRYLYVGDIGDNDERRKTVTVYRFPEPAISPADAASTRRSPSVTEAAEALTFKYPDGAHDAETLLVHPETGDLYIVVKIFLSNPTIYKASAPLNGQNVITLAKVGELKLPSLLAGTLTGGSVSPDGRKVIFCDYVEGYELEQPTGSRTFDDMWKQPAKVVDLGKRPQGEAVAYRLDGGAVLATSEGLHATIFRVIRR
jgi:hypothetical protein